MTLFPPSSRLPIIEQTVRPGFVQFEFGHPASELLPSEDLRRAAAEVIPRHGDNALYYGYGQGPGPLIEWLATRIATLDGLPVTPEQLLITGGASLALDQICSLLTEPGDVVLIPVPTYHLAVRIFQEHPLELVALPGDALGADVEALAETTARLKAEGKRVRLIYLVPTFANPSGATLPLERRRALLDLASREGLLIVEDDVYRDLAYDGPPPPSLFSLAPVGPVIRLGSFSKTLAPGLRVGWMLADPAMIARFVNSGLLDSGGGTQHFASLVVETFLAMGLYDAHLERACLGYRKRRDALLAALERYLPTGCNWSRPGGGYFVWLGLPEGCDSEKLVSFATAECVSFLTGKRFGLGLGYRDHVRLSFSLLGPAELEEGARRLAKAIERLIG